jgi:hypothetical protein
MLPRFRPRLSYANVISTLALFIALGGGAYAATSLPKNSVGSKQIKQNAVSSSKVKDHSLTAGDVRSGQFATPAQLAGYLPLGATAANATNASNATNATNATKLGNLDPGAFERATRIQYGGGVGSSEASTVLFSWPEIGLEVKTDGDLDQNAQIRLHNTGPGGLQYSNGPAPGPGVFGLVSGADVEVGNAAVEFALQDIYVMQNNGPKMMMIRCFDNVFGASDGQIHCYGFRSSPS